jgi:alkanesulfonate monooxygenase SsuD/methylene tetrahydromethanopterin reductase-like flavin-dependent oxidoreductase (luciferase family)
MSRRIYNENRSYCNPARRRNRPTYAAPMQHALFLPPYGELADPRGLMDLASGAEAEGWDGLFLWDHVLRAASEPPEVADPWIALSAIATVTTSLRLGPMITPLARRRPQKLAREAVTLDHLSAGRLTLGLGLGVDSYGELSRFGEVTDPATRGDILDEGADLLDALWSGEEVHHDGPHFRADGVRFLPRPLQLPRVPLWFAVTTTATRPVRRAARYDGIFPIGFDPDGFTRVLDLVKAERGGLDGFDGFDGFDVAIVAGPDVDVADLEARGATWAMWQFRPGATVGEVAAFLDGGPPEPERCR